MRALAMLACALTVLASMAAFGYALWLELDEERHGYYT